MPSPTFSVAVPIGNHTDFLDTALRSLEAQNVDMQVAALDATADDRAQQILGARRVPIAYGYHHPDEGQAAAIQEGWTRTRGDVVAWLNADDYYFPHALDRVGRVFAARPDVDVVFGHAVHASAACDFLAYFPAIDPDPRALVTGCTICQPSCFVRRRALDEVGGLNPALHYTMDWDLWLRLHRAGRRFEFLDAPLSVVRVHSATKTMSRARDRYREIAGLLASAGATAVRRWRTLAGFYTYDLENRRTGAGERMLYGVLSAAGRARGRLRTRRAVHGLECWTNVVRGDCRVDMPWYGDTSAAQVTVVSDRRIDLAFASSGEAGPLVPQGAASVPFRGASVRGYLHGARVAVRDRTLSMDLRSDGSSWRLLRVSAA